jgi:hypothetical protein
MIRVAQYTSSLATSDCRRPTMLMLTLMLVVIPCRKLRQHVVSKWLKLFDRPTISSMIITELTTTHSQLYNLHFYLIFSNLPLFFLMSCSRCRQWMRLLNNGRTISEGLSECRVLQKTKHRRGAT